MNYLELVKTLTVSVPDDVYEQALRKAQDRQLSLDELIAELVAGRRITPQEFQRLERLQQEWFAAPADYHFSARQRLTRDEIHDRRLFR